MRILLWFFFWPVMGPVWLWRRGRVGQVVLGVLVLGLVVIGLASPDPVVESGDSPGGGPVVARPTWTPTVMAVPTETPVLTNVPTETPVPTEVPAATGDRAEWEHLLWVVVYQMMAEQMAIETMDSVVRGEADQMEALGGLIVVGLFLEATEAELEYSYGPVVEPYAVRAQFVQRDIEAAVGDWVNGVTDATETLALLNEAGGEMLLADLGAGMMNQGGFTPEEGEEILARMRAEFDEWATEFSPEN